METKKWWQSKSVWSGIASILLGVVPLIDMNFGTELSTSPLYGTLVSFTGAMGIKGRVDAKTVIK